MGTDAPDHFREPGNVTAGTVRDTHPRHSSYYYRGGTDDNSRFRLILWRKDGFPKVSLTVRYESCSVQMIEFLFESQAKTEERKETDRTDE